MRVKRKNRLLSMGLCLCMLLGTFPLPDMAYAADRSCPGHQTHTQECGYAEAVEGAPCRHIEAGEHDGSCGYSKGTQEVPCDMGCTETGEDGQIIHAEGCAHTPAVPGTPCRHEQGEHDENCGYSEGVEDSPCTHTCELCDGRTDDPPAVCAKDCTLPNGHEGECVTEPPTDAPFACTCETTCAEGTVDESCPVCAAAGADLADCTGILVPQATQQAAGTTYIVSNANELNNACDEANPGDTILFRDWTGGNQGSSSFALGVHVIFGSFNGGVMIWIQNSELASVRVEQGWSITLDGSSHVEDVILEDGSFKLNSGTVENVEMTGGNFLQGGGTVVTGAFVYEGGSFSSSIYLGENGTFQNLSGASADVNINGAQVTVAPGSTVDKNGTVVAGNLITGEGYTFDPVSGKLTITTDEGTAKWREDPDIAVEDTERYQAIRSVEVIDGVRFLGNTAFGYCVNLTSVALPSSIEGLGYWAFENCTGLTEMDLTHLTSLTVIGQRAFSGCTGLTDIKLPASLERIEHLAFKGCTGLTELDLSALTNLTDIEVSVFSGCTSLASVDLPASLTTLGTYAFSDCTSLNKLTFLSDTAPNIDPAAFLNVSQTGTIYFLPGPAQVIPRSGKMMPGCPAGRWRNRLRLSPP